MTDTHAHSFTAEQTLLTTQQVEARGWRLEAGDGRNDPEKAEVTLSAILWVALPNLEGHHMCQGMSPGSMISMRVRVG